MAAASVSMAVLTVPKVQVYRRPDATHLSASSQSATCGVGRASSKSAAFFGEASYFRGARAEPAVCKSIGTMAVRASVGLENDVKEPVTGVKFLGSVIPPGATTGLALAGAGVREKKIAFLKVKVYAVGLYVDPSVADSLKAWKAKSASELEQDEGFYKAIVDAPVEKSIRIVLVRDVDGGQFWDALGETLVPRLKAAGAGVAGEKALAALGDVFRTRSLKNNTAVFLTWVPPSTLHISVSVDGQTPTSVEATIESQHLLPSLFDIYLGNDPVSPSARAAIAKGIF